MDATPLTPRSRPLTRLCVPSAWFSATLCAGAWLHALAREHDLGQAFSVIGQVTDAVLQERVPLSASLVNRLEAIQRCSQAGAHEAQTARPRMAALLTAFNALTQSDAVDPDALWAQWMPEIPALTARILGSEGPAAELIAEYVRDYQLWLQPFCPTRPLERPLESAP